MKDKVSKFAPWVAVLAAVLFLTCCGGACKHAHSATPEPALSGSIGVQSQFSTGPWSFDEQFSQVFGEFKITNFAGPINMFGDVYHNMKQRPGMWEESNFRLGLSAPLTRDNMLECFSFWERRYRTNDNRYVVGMRLNFDSKL